MNCPYCDAEVGSDDLFCGECGKRLPTPPGKGRKIATPIIGGIVAVVILGCIIVGGVVFGFATGVLRLAPQASPTPTVIPSPTLPPPPTFTATPSVTWLTYQSDELGVSVQYPQGWFMEEDLSIGQVMFAESEDDLDMDTFLRGTSLGIASDTTEALEMETAEEILQFVIAFLSETYPDAEIGEIEPYRIANLDGALVTMEGEFEEEGVQLRAWVVAVVLDDYGYILLAAAPVEDWGEQGPILQAMLDSVELSRPVTPSPVTGPDAYEPDDSIAQANPISTDGIPQAHNLHVEGDHDYVSFVAEAGTAYTIETLNLGSDMDTVIHLYDGDENELASDDDEAEEPLASRIIWIAPSSGTYYVMIRDYDEDSAGADATYSIFVLAGTAPQGDQYEPDDNIAQARPITTDGTSQAHNLHLEGDHDYVSFVAEAGTAYTIETLNLGIDMDTVIHLYDSQENELASDDDEAEEPLASRITWTAPSSGTYYVMIRDLGENSAGADATYSVRVLAGTAPQGDQYEPDDSIAQASSIDTDGTRQTHTFHTSTDADYVYFSAQQGIEYTIETGNLRGDCDTQIYLYDEDGEELSYDDDDGDEPLASRIVWTAPSSGTYYVMVDEYSDRAGPGVSYEIWVSG